MTKNRQHGFSLTEMAIVLAVFGAIVGGIWSAAQGVRSGNTLRVASEQINQVSQNIREYYMNASVITVTSGDGVDATRMLDGYQLFPATMRTPCSGCSGTNFKIDGAYGPTSSYGSGIGNGSFRVVVPGGTGSVFQIIMMGVPAKACARLLFSAINYRDQTMGITSVCASTNSTHNCYSQGAWNAVTCTNNICDTSTNITLARAETLCGSTTSEVGWQYDLRH